MVTADTFFFPVFYRNQDHLPPNPAPPTVTCYPRAPRKAGVERGTKRHADRLAADPSVGCRADKPKQKQCTLRSDHGVSAEESKRMHGATKTASPTLRGKEGINIAHLQKLEEISIENQVAENTSFTQKFSCRLVPLSSLRILRPTRRWPYDTSSSGSLQGFPAGDHQCLLQFPDALHQQDKDPSP